MSAAFLDLVIYPSYSNRTAIIAWTVSHELADAEFYVYRKDDGGATYTLLNETVPAYGTTYADSTFFIKNRSQVPMYRVVAKLGDALYDSPEVALYSRTGKLEYGLAYNIIREKYQQARCDGVPVLYYPLVKSGKLSAALDDITGQRLEAYCPDDYGGYFDSNSIFGSYYRPFVTYVRFLGAKVVRETRLEDGTWDDDIQMTEFLPFPPVRTNDMIVDVATDRRYFVGSSIKANRLKGIIPLCYTGTLELQSTNQPCYKVPIPDNYMSMVSNLTEQYFK